MAPQKPLTLTFEGRAIFYYPTAHTGQYVRVDRIKGEPTAALTTGIGEGHPLWPLLRPASLDAPTLLEHALAIARELAAVEGTA